MTCLLFFSAFYIIWHCVWPSFPERFCFYLIMVCWCCGLLVLFAVFTAFVVIQLSCSQLKAGRDKDAKPSTSKQTTTEATEVRMDVCSIICCACFCFDCLFAVILIVPNLRWVEFFLTIISVLVFEYGLILPFFSLC